MKKPSRRAPAAKAFEHAKRQEKKTKKNRAHNEHTYITRDCCKEISVKRVFLSLGAKPLGGVSENMGRRSNSFNCMWHGIHLLRWLVEIQSGAHGL